MPPKTLEQQISDLRHDINNLKTQIAPVLKRNMQLEDDVSALAETVRDLTKVISEQNLSIREMKNTLEGDKLNVGVYKRIQDLEAFVKWFKEKKAVATGYALGISGILTIGWILAEVILKAKDYIKHIVK